MTQLGAFLTLGGQRVRVDVEHDLGRDVLALFDGDGGEVTRCYADTLRQATHAGLVFYPSNSGDARPPIRLDLMTIGRVLDALTAHNRRIARLNQEAS